MSITLGEIKGLVLAAAGATALVMLSIALYHLIRLLVGLNTIVIENRENVRKTLTELPDAVSKLKDVAGELKGVTEKAGSVVSSVDSAVAGFVTSAKQTSGSLMAGIRAAGEVVSGIAGIIRKRKQSSKEQSE